MKNAPMPQTNNKGIARSWLVMGLAAQGLAAILFVSSAVSSERPASVSRDTAVASEVVEEVEPLAAPTAMETAAAPPSRRKQPMA